LTDSDTMYLITTYHISGHFNICVYSYKPDGECNSGSTGEMLHGVNICFAVRGETPAAWTNICEL